MNWQGLKNHVFNGQEVKERTSHPWGETRAFFLCTAAIGYFSCAAFPLSLSGSPHVSPVASLGQQARHISRIISRWHQKISSSSTAQGRRDPVTKAPAPPLRKLCNTLEEEVPKMRWMRPQRAGWAGPDSSYSHSQSSREMEYIKNTHSSCGRTTSTIADSGMTDSKQIYPLSTLGLDTRPGCMLRHCFWIS